MENTEHIIEQHQKHRSALRALKKFKMALAGATSIAFYSRFKGRPLALWTSTFNC